MTDYCGGVIYENGVISKILTSEGYVTADGRHYFYLKDHLESVRVVFDQTGQVVERNSYYPFGMMYGESVGANSKQRFKFNGKELMTMHGLNLLDYGARFHYGSDGRWTTFDPLAEIRPWESPYCFTGNNPMNRVDPNGMLWDESQLTDAQREKWRDVIETSSNSSAFKEMYDQLDKSATIYKVNIGETKNDVPGQFNRTTQTITFQSENSMGTMDVHMEEIFHAYQYDNNSLYEKGKPFNIT